MKLMKIGAMLLTMTLAAGTLLTGCGGGNGGGSADAGGTTIIKVGHVLSETTADHQFFLQLEKDFEEKTDGRYDIQIYPNGTLGGERDLYEAVQMGTIGMTLVSSGIIANAAPDLNVLDMPYLFKDLNHARTVLHGEIGDDLLAAIDATGVKALGWTETGFRNCWTVGKAINSLADLKGVKMRTQEITPHMDFFRAAGADPTSMAWGDAYTGLQQGAIDGIEVPNGLSYTLSVYEVADHYAITEHVFTTCPVIMSQKLWDSMSEEDQNTLMECAEAAFEMESQLSEEMNNDYLDKLIEEGTIVTYPDKTEFMEVAESVHEKYADTCGNWIDRINAAYEE